MLLIALWVLNLLACVRMSQLTVSHSLTHSAVQAVKFPVSPQSCQAWRIERKAADK